MSLRHSCLIAVSLTFLVLLVSGPVMSQTTESGIGPALPRGSAASYYYIGKPGELTMHVNLWGFVKNPGRYEVPSSTDLIQLVSFAGGPVQGAKMDKVRITRFIKRENAVERSEYVVDLEDLYRVDQAKLVLYPGDTIFIDHTSWLTIRDAFTVISTAAIITSAVVNIIRVTK